MPSFHHVGRQFPFKKPHRPKLSAFKRIPSFRRPSFSRNRSRKIFIAFASRKRSLQALILLGVVIALSCGLIGYQALPALNGTSVSWGLGFTTPQQPPTPPPLGAQLLEQYGGLYIADTNQPTVYFTYDLGFEAGYTSDVLDVLRDKNVHATFFICGHYCDNEDTLVRRMLNDGHSIGNHTNKHKNSTRLSTAEIQKEILDLQTKFEEKYGAKMQFYRPPEGKFNEQTFTVTQELGLHPLLWSLAYADYERDKTIGKQAVLKVLMGRIHNGAVMLFHIMSADVASTLPDLIDTLRAQGYTIGEPQDLLSLTKSNPAPAQ